MNTISSIFAPKDKRVQFQVEITIDRLTDIPLVYGRLFVRWKIRNALNDHRGTTQSSALRDHVVIWDNKFTTKINMIIGKDDILIPCYLHFNVKKETDGGRKSESIGKGAVDLAEFVGSELNTRQYLLQQSKINSSIKLNVVMTQISGDPVCRAPEVARKTGYQGIQNILKTGEPQSMANGDDIHVEAVPFDLPEFERDPIKIVDEIFQTISAREEKLMRESGVNPHEPIHSGKD